MSDQKYGLRIQLLGGTSLYDTLTSEGSMSDEVFHAEAEEMAERIATKGLSYQTTHGRAFIPPTAIYAVEYKPNGPYEMRDHRPIEFVRDHRPIEFR